MAVGLMEVAEVMLARAYEGSRDGSEYSVEFNQVAKELGIPDGMARRAIELLEGRGLVKCIWGMGAFIGHLTPEGHALVEGGGSTGAIRRYRSNPTTFILGPGSTVISAPVAGDVNSVSVGGSVTSSIVQSGRGNQAATVDWDQLRRILGELRAGLPALAMDAETRAEVAADLAAATAVASKRTPESDQVRPLLTSVERSLGLLDKAGGALTFLRLVGAAIALLG